MRVVNREVLVEVSKGVEDAQVKDVWSRLSHAAKELWVREDNLLGVKMGMNDYAITVDGKEFIGCIEARIEEHEELPDGCIRVLEHDEALDLKKHMKYKLA